ncbi:MAG: hypothetical protein E7486_04400 [Ruminococcaceae bacterium]|nr:hypothetical protein [Oscillospiraceae bacterium]
MMIRPESFYEENLKGKTAEQIATIIRSLKQNIGRLKNRVENPDYICPRKPSDKTIISFFQAYLERAKQALAEAGGTYVPSAAEKKAIEFEANIPSISKVVFTIGGFFHGHKRIICTVNDDRVQISSEYPRGSDPFDFDKEEIVMPGREAFLEQLKKLHIGEWRRCYSAERFGHIVYDGTQWDLKIYYSNNRKPVEISGDNAYPYNFDQFLALIEMEEGE